MATLFIMRLREGRQPLFRSWKQSLFSELMAQVGLKSTFGFVNSSSGSNTILTQNLVGIGLSHFGKDLNDDFFLRGLAGFTLLSSGSTTTTNFSAGFDLGKKFALNSFVSWTPSFSTIFTVNGTPTLTFNLLRFGIFF